MSVSRQFSQSFVRYEVAYARAPGSDPMCALFLSYLTFRCSDGREAKQSHSTCERFTALSRYQQDRAATLWEGLGVISKHLAGSPPEIHYVVDFQRLDELLRGLDEPDLGEDNLQETRKSICKKLANGMQETRRSICKKLANPLTIEEQEKEQERTPPYKAPRPVDDVEREVEEVYAAYPRKVGKGQAIRAIRAALKLAGFEVLLASTQAFADAVAQWPEPERQFVPYPATWFNGRRWEDDRSTWARAGRSRPSAPAERPAWMVAKAEGLRIELKEAERQVRIAQAQNERGNYSYDLPAAERERDRIRAAILQLGEQP